MAEEKSCGHIVTDECDCSTRKPLDVNKYATKKTIAQGMLDIALLTANASQLKYILQVGKQHEFYTLMLSLIILSIILQVGQAILGAVLGSIYNINKKKDQRNANTVNNILLATNIIIVALNVIISGFDLREKARMLNLYESFGDDEKSVPNPEISF
ncbi:UNVERIFIED_CONTAM: hypothetical protein PYX00_004423 [Menopon gallinae]|uniref:Ninjurin-2 n=1 Tax=Menopon gallinae TaxID=328185 RepID=A0AAW2I4X0_9NEOP